MAPDQTANARRIIGRRQTDNSYNILIAPWELPYAPKSWRSDLDFFDEFWAESRFIAEAFRPIFSKPMQIVPPCVNVDAPQQADRRKFGLDAQRFYFFFHSISTRVRNAENPAAIVRAFALAFSDRNDDVGLVFKISWGRGSLSAGSWRT